MRTVAVVISRQMMPLDTQLLSPADADVMVINAISLSPDTSSTNGFMLHNLLQLCLRGNMNSLTGSILIHFFSLHIIYNILFT